ncbi:MAG: hypothetical protein KF744_13400 [Taibaiella sp.]|nr:hypothetical protein [Taibaiella sp.]
MPLLSFDQRYTFLETSINDNTPVNFRGIKLGATIMERHRTGIGVYNVLQQRLHLRWVNGVNTNLNFDLRYITVFYEYYFVYTKRWDVGIPFEIGAGRYGASDTASARNGLVWPIGTGIDVHLKLHRWLALTTMGGYRVVGNNNSGVKLNNWFYSFGVAISTRHMLEDTRYFFKRKKCNREVRRLQHQER